MTKRPGTVVQVNVTPISVKDDKAVCAITPRRVFPDQEYVVGGVIVLKPTGAPYTVEFYIEPGIDSGLPDLSFNMECPFSCNVGSCPDIDDHNPHMRPQPQGPKNLTISPPPASGAAQIYYSLNFDGSRFDPIIVKT